MHVLGRGAVVGDDGAGGEQGGLGGAAVGVLDRRGLGFILDSALAVWGKSYRVSNMRYLLQIS